MLQESKSKFGHYSIVSELGRGGMGVVYKAYEESLNRVVAVKVLSRHLTADEQYLERFRREARSIAQLNHPNVVQIYYVGEEDGQHFYAMEFVAGQSVQDLIRSEGRIANPRAAQLTVQAAAGLAAAHGHGILHRDIKPANLLVTEDGVVKIADFGIAHVSSETTRLTADGRLMGTGGYLSPEQYDGKEADARSDIYSLGVTYYEMLSGRIPFDTKSPYLMLKEILEYKPKPIGEVAPEVDPRTRAILGKMMARDPADRFADARELEADLQSYLATSLVPGLGQKTSTQAVPTVAATVSPPAQSRTEQPTVVLENRPPGTAVEDPVVPAVEVVPSQAQALVPQQQALTTTGRSGGNRATIVLVAVAILILGAISTAAWKLGRPLLFGGDPDPVSAESTTADAGRAPVAAGTLGGAGVALVNADSSEAETNAVEADPVSDASPPEVDRSGAEADSSRETSAPAGAEEPARGSAAAAGGPAAQDAASPRAREQAHESQRPPAPASGIALVVMGNDPTLAGPIEAYCERRLGAAALELVDERGLPALRDLPGHPDMPISHLLSAMRGTVRHLVVVRAEQAGQRPLEYLGRFDTAFQSHVTVTMFDVETQRALAGSESTLVEYTLVATDRAVANALRPMVGRMIDRLTQ